MTRFDDICPTELDTEQQRVHDEIAAGKRGRVAAPHRVWLQSPAFADRAQKLGELLRYDTTLTPVLSELAILVTARQWTAQYEWYAHAREATKAGLNPQIIEAIRLDQQPSFADPKQQVVYDFATMLHRERNVPEALYRTALTALGQRGVVELVGLLGYYSLISMTLNVFEVPVPVGETAPLR